MRWFGLVFVLLVADCGKPTSAPASIAFIERPGGYLAWDFEAHGLPAMDTRTGAIVVADVSHGSIVRSLALSLRWLRPGATEPVSTFSVLEEPDASGFLVEDEEAENARLTASVRARTVEAGLILARMNLRPMVACVVASAEAGGCVHPQRVTCGELAADLRGDILTWSDGKTTTLGWSIEPMQIGDGPPKEMITCIDEAHLDEAGMRLVARIERSCKGGGPDACYLPASWRAVAVR